MGGGLRAPQARVEGHPGTSATLVGGEALFGFTDKRVLTVLFSEFIF